MTPQEKILLQGAVGTLIGRFAFHRDWKQSLVIGLAAIAVISIITAKPETAST